jgi:protein subunit release factor A
LHPNILGVYMIIEIRAAEGGLDSKLLVEDQFSIYLKLAKRRGL